MNVFGVPVRSIFGDVTQGCQTDSDGYRLFLKPVFRYRFFTVFGFSGIFRYPSLRIEVCAGGRTEAAAAGDDDDGNENMSTRCGFESNYKKVNTKSVEKGTTKEKSPVPLQLRAAGKMGEGGGGGGGGVDEVRKRARPPHANFFDD